MKRVLIDQGLPASTAAILRTDGWDATHVGEIGMNEASDAAILDLAFADSRVVITLDRDFPHILALTVATRPRLFL